jgi:hypothetical protein
MFEDEKPAAPDEMERLRSVALSEDAEEGVAFVEHKGSRFEVRAPSLELQASIRRKSTSVVKDAMGKAKKDPSGQALQEQDQERAMVLTVIGCTYAPGTTKRVFTMADAEVLLSRRITQGSLLLKLAKAITKLSAVSMEEDEKNSESVPTSDSSFE